MPQGFTYGIAQTNYRGLGHLERAASGVLRASYYFESSRTSGARRTTGRTAEGRLAGNRQGRGYGDRLLANPQGERPARMA
ncbi:DUF4360 domain-containing protein [Lentzea sp. NPDC051838]|uniref:DUF4360 domain-containing protein n=1 Tax=Lentzea sp. NPDC051838 TaxID=3154849 RepID=UPI003426A63C